MRGDVEVLQEKIAKLEREKQALEAKLARIAEGVLEMKLHDHTGDPVDRGYTMAWEEVCALLDL